MKEMVYKIKPETMLDSKEGYLLIFTPERFLRQNIRVVSYFKPLEGPLSPSSPYDFLFFYLNLNLHPEANQFYIRVRSAGKKIL